MITREFLSFKYAHTTRYKTDIYLFINKMINGKRSSSIREQINIKNIKNFNF